MLLALFVASPGAFMAPGQGLSAPLRSLSASLRLPNCAAGAASVARVPAASMSSAPVGTELIDYLFFIPFALILFALGAGARSVLMGDDGLFSQVTAALTRGLTLALTPTLSLALAPNVNVNPNLAQMNEDPDSIKAKIREARSSNPSPPEPEPEPEPEPKPEPLTLAVALSRRAPRMGPPSGSGCPSCGSPSSTSSRCTTSRRPRPPGRALPTRPGTSVMMLTLTL